MTGASLAARLMMDLGGWAVDGSAEILEEMVPLPPAQPRR